MTSRHERMQQMAASAIDGRLTASEQDELEAHLAGCLECRAFHAALRRDNAALVEVLAPVSVPADLRATLAEVERAGPPPARHLARGRAVAMPSLASILVVVIVLTLAAGGGLWLASRAPAPTGASPASPATPSPTPVPSASAGATVGGASILVYGFNEEDDETTLSLLDAGTGHQTSLGELPHRSVLEHTQLQRSADRGRLLITRTMGGTLVEQLAKPTEAASQLRFACCLPDGFYGWALSPDGDLVAGMKTDVTVDHVIAVVIAPADGGARRSLPVPADVVFRLPNALPFGDIAWAPDGSALAMVGCVGCPPLQPSGSATEFHWKLFVMPIDGSPIREVIDLPRAGLTNPRWSPDGSEIAVMVIQSRCAPTGAPPKCADTTRLAIVDVVGGGLSEVALSSPDPPSGMAAWSPDGTRLAFFDGPQLVVVSANGNATTDLTTASETPATDPNWSPDGRWLLYGTKTEDTAQDVWRLWIVPADGGEARLLGTARAWTW